MLLIYNTFAASIDIGAMVVTRRGLAYGQAESNRFPDVSRPEHKGADLARDIDRRLFRWLCPASHVLCRWSTLQAAPLVETRRIRRVAMLLFSTAPKIATLPTSTGSVLRVKGRSARANTKAT